MVEFEVTYESNLEPGQFIQKCECSDAVVTVIPRSERDASSVIPFSGSLYSLGRGRLLEDSGGEVEEWRTGKHSIGTYNLDIRPRVGTTHHDYVDIPLDQSFQKDIPFEGNRTAFIEAKVSRKDSMIYDIPYDFFIEEDSTADASPPWYESPVMSVLTNDLRALPPNIIASSVRFGVPRILILSIAFMETSHGYYDEPFEWTGTNKSIRPMNVNVDYWPMLFNEDDMYDQAKNVDAGTFMLKRIIERLSPNDRTVRKIATLYQNINAVKVSDYGARVDFFTKNLNPAWLSE